MSLILNKYYSFSEFVPIVKEYLKEQKRIEDINVNKLLNDILINDNVFINNHFTVNRYYLLYEKFLTINVIDIVCDIIHCRNNQIDDKYREIDRDVEIMDFRRLDFLRRLKIIIENNIIIY